MKKPKVLFVTFSIEPLLEKLLQAHRNDLIFHSKPIEMLPMSDIHNGEIYNNIVRSHGAVIAIGTNTDGVQRFNCSKDSLWPQYLVCYNISQKKRLRHENIIVSALFSGRNIDMSDFYEQFVTELKKINLKGGLQLENKKIPVFCINAALDSMARPKLQQHTQFNGHYGCSFCITRGESIGKSMKYPKR